MHIKEEALKGLTASLALGAGKDDVPIAFELVEVPKEDIRSFLLVSEQIKLVNQIMFDDIQELQKPEASRRGQKVILAEVQRLDDILN